MSFDPDISVMALVQVLQRLRFVQTLRVDMPSLEKAWLATAAAWLDTSYREAGNRSARTAVTADRST